MLKCQFHTHSAGDLLDYIPHTEKDLISQAAKLNYNVLAITCHHKVVFSPNLKKYAQKKNILLIPGIELSIGKKHVLAINVGKDIQKVKTFSDLRNYKNTHKECLIIAPHPFFPSKHSLKKALIENMDIFDAIEYCFCYTKTKNYNKEAEAVAKRWRKPVIASADCHCLKDLDLAYTMLDCKPNIHSVISAIKKNKIKNFSKPLGYLKIGKIITRQSLRNLIKKGHV
ncbi:MAG: PHP-associated domain-containing protein [Candidatus Peregrinibacteria bacterium]